MLSSFILFLSIHPSSLSFHLLPSFFCSSFSNSFSSHPSSFFIANSFSSLLYLALSFSPIIQLFSSVCLSPSFPPDISSFHFFSNNVSIFSGTSGKPSSISPAPWSENFYVFAQEVIASQWEAWPKWHSKLPKWLTLAMKCKSAKKN